jgi:hypothetical protein
MSTRTHERTRGTSSHRQALLSAMRVYLTAPFFRKWKDWIGARGGRGAGDGPCRISISRPC